MGAKLRHRISGLRVVEIGAGQQTTTGESALKLDAVLAADARALHDLLVRGGPAGSADAEEPGGAEPAGPTDPAAGADASGQSVGSGVDSAPIRVFARFRPGWVVYNMFNAWAYLLVLGVGWGAYWMLGSVGVDVAGFVADLLDWAALGWGWTIVIAFVVVSLLGAIGLGVNYFTEYWNFELARVPGEKGTLLRTRQGLLTTREVNRDENRVRGVQISEPVLWRWMGVSDTTVVTTGLNMWSLSQSAAILPRGPVAVARRVAGEVLGGDVNPLRAPLPRHPRAALRRRLWWATAASAFVAAVLVWLAATGVVPAAAIWGAAAFWPIALLAAVVAYRALGHAIAGPYLVARSGLVSRATTVLRRSAVSTIVIRESLLQRRLGLRTVSAMTAAGYGGYDVPDIAADESVAFAFAAAPHLLTPFLRTSVPRDGEAPIPSSQGATATSPSPR